MLIDRSTLNYKCLHYLPSVGGKENHPLGGGKDCGRRVDWPSGGTKDKKGREWAWVGPRVNRAGQVGGASWVGGPRRAACQRRFRRFPPSVRGPLTFPSCALSEGEGLVYDVKTVDAERAPRLLIARFEFFILIFITMGWKGQCVNLFKINKKWRGRPNFSGTVEICTSRICLKFIFD